MLLKLKTLFTIFIILVLPFSMSAQTGEKITATRLKEMITELGYEPKNISTTANEKYEIVLKTPTLNIPLGLELSASGNYIWLTAFLGKTSERADSLQMSYDLLKRNAIIQPVFFYITEKGSIMSALALENRCLTNAILKTKMDFISDKVESTKPYWMKQ